MFRIGVSLVIAAASATLLTISISLLVRRCYNFSKRGTKVSEDTTHTRGIMEGIQSRTISQIQSSTRHKHLFNWSHHPSFISDAAEKGWPGFAFAPCQSTKSSITWEVGDGSVEFMQKIRINPGLKKLSLNCLRTALPLPGPPIGNPSSFPQEAYFEITILSISSNPSFKSKGEGEKTKLIRLDEFDQHQLTIGSGSSVMISLGLTCNSTLVPLKIPGSYHGSIGFNSEPSVYLDGMKLNLELEIEDWGQEKKVIGCGFDPRKKKVFFTVDSRVVHVGHCKSEEFSTPLYPVIAANAEMTVLVNLGQSSFSYEPANDTRTTNPCFLGSLVRSRADLGYEDSGELFSMGRIDSGWHRNDDDESDADLFEIVLDVNGQSPNE